jgi:inactivated superfamily I helicase
MEYGVYHNRLHSLKLGKFKIGWEKLCEVSAYKEWAKASRIILEAINNSELVLASAVWDCAKEADIKEKTFKEAKAQLRKEGLIALHKEGFQGAWWISSTPKGYLYAHPQIAEGAGLGGQ